MTWTSTPPVEPGWYWYRGAYDASSMAVQPVAIYVERDADRVVAWQPFMDYADPIDQMRGEWWTERIEPPPDFSVIPLASERQKRQKLVCVDCGEVINALPAFIPDPPQCQQCNPMAYR